MANFQTFSALGEQGELTDFIDGDTVDLTSFSTTEIVLSDAQGDSVTWSGNVVVTVFGPSGGTINRFTVESAAGKTLFSGTGMNIDVVDLLVAAESGIADVIDLVFSGNDSWTGSRLGDLLDGLGGRDTLEGGRGNDILHGGTGNDTLWGGSGTDKFVFHRGDDVETISDFSDDGSRGADDKILISQALYRNMDVTQKGDNVELSFGRGDKLILLGADADLIDRGDFSFL